MTRVLLINPPSPYLENDAAYPPMGLMYIASSLEQIGCPVNILDFTVEPKNLDILKHCSQSYDLVGITCVTPNVNAVTEIVNAIDPKVLVMVGGAHPTYLPHETIRDTACTFVVQGEAEMVLPDIIRDLQTGSLAKCYYGGIVPVDAIPKPTRYIVDLHEYSPGGDKATPVYTSRGCPYNCRFCCKGNKYREFPIPKVIEEVNDCKALGFDKIVFGDDNIGLNPIRLMDLLEALKPLDITFRLNMDARKPRDYICADAAGSGCTEISFGIESGSQQMLDAMNKQTTIAMNEESIYQTQRYGMEAKAYFMVNFPGETEDTVKGTLSFAERVHPDKWLLSAFAPLPGSYVFNNPKQFGITSMSKNWSDYYLVGKGGKFLPCFETKYLTHEKQIELHTMIWNGLKEILG
jgi:anaerobic magnesium-protoporphyrin IX monomethyl ester cyclase